MYAHQCILLVMPREKIGHNQSYVPGYSIKGLEKKPSKARYFSRFFP